MAQEPIIVDVDGYGPIEFPAGMSDDQIDEAIRRMPPPEVTAAGRERAAASDGLGAGPGAGLPPEMAPMTSRDGGTSTTAGARAGDAITRAAGGFLSNFNMLPLVRRTRDAVFDPRGPQTGIGEMALELGGNIAASHADTARKAAERFRHARDSRGLDRALAATEALGYGLATAVPVLGPAAAAVGERGASGDVAGAIGEGTGMALGATGIMGRASRAAFNRPANALGRFVMKTDDPALVDAALRNRAMPGIIRSGARRAEARIRSNIRSAQDEIARSGAGSTPVRVRRSNIHRAWDELTRTSRRSANTAAARPVAAESLAFASTRPSVDAALRRSEFERLEAAAGSDPADVMQRAASADLRGAVGQAVPGAAGPLSRVDELDRVAAAHNRSGVAISHEGLPGMQLRIGASVANRALGPIAQGLYNTGRVSPDLLRAAVLINLIERGATGLDPEMNRPMASH